MWFSKNKFIPEHKTAVVIGASQGLGADIALSLYQRNCNVILVARTESKLKAQVARIKKTRASSAEEKSESISKPGEQTQNKQACVKRGSSLSLDATLLTKKPLLEYYVCDVSDYKKCVEMWTILMDKMKLDPDFIFSCAGSSVPKLFIDLSGKEIAAGMSINYLTAANVVHAWHKAVLQRNAGKLSKTMKQRHIILFSSVTASFPFIGYGQYAPAKAALSTLSLVLRQELMYYNYRVSCVHAGNFASEGYEEENKIKPEITKDIEGPSDAISTIECCDLVFDKLAKGYDSIYTDFIGWVLGLSVLGTHPRCWGFFQIFMLLIFLIIEPIAFHFAVVLPIRKHHKDEI